LFIGQFIVGGRYLGDVFILEIGGVYLGGVFILEIVRNKPKMGIKISISDIASNIWVF